MHKGMGIVISIDMGMVLVMVMDIDCGYGYRLGKDIRASLVTGTVWLSICIWL